MRAKYIFYPSFLRARSLSLALTPSFCLSLSHALSLFHSFSLSLSFICELSSALHSFSSTEQANESNTTHISISQSELFTSIQSDIYGGYGLCANNGALVRIDSKNIIVCVSVCARLAYEMTTINQRNHIDVYNTSDGIVKPINTTTRKENTTNAEERQTTMKFFMCHFVPRKDTQFAKHIPLVDVKVISHTRKLRGRIQFYYFLLR